MWYSILIDILFLAVAVGLFAAILLAVSYLLRRGRRIKAAESQRDSRQDLVSMTILFQTMRDIVEQQKALARALNKSLDTKVAYIKESVDTALGDVQVLRDSVKDLSRIIEETRSGLVCMQASVTPSFDEAPHKSALEEHERPVLQILAKPAPPVPKDDVIDSWAGLDFGSDWPDAFAADVPEELPDVAEDADSAREAFRALLNLDAMPPSRQRAVREFRSVQQESGGNGKVNALHARVYEYSDAGMGIAQIARELGLGKGEVRLILGLRKDRGR